MHKLLLADDSVTIQRVIELTFSGEDVQVLAVNDGEQAIARIPLERPDVVLADIGMPRKGGYDVSAFVKGRADLAHIPVLLLAGAFEPVDQARAEQVKADGVLIKPFEPRQVIERVRELLSLVPQAPARDAVPQAPARDAVPRAPASEASALPGAALPVIEAKPVRVPEAVEPDPAALPTALEADTSQSLDELFASLNQALGEPLTATTQSRASSITTEAATEPEPQLDAERDAFVLEPAVAFEPLGASSNGTVLDDYFDRLSPAFEEASAPPQEVFQPGPDRLEDLAPPQAGAVETGAQTLEEWPAEEWLPPVGSPIAFDWRGAETNPILDAVAALMAPDSGRSPADAVVSSWDDVSAPAAPAAAISATSQALIDAVTERVLARLVPEITESLRRLVQQEVARAQRDVH
jgi:CheY-like chemotaxis protein